MIPTLSLNIHTYTHFYSYRCLIFSVMKYRLTMTRLLITTALLIKLCSNLFSPFPESLSYFNDINHHLYQTLAFSITIITIIIFVCSTLLFNSSIKLYHNSLYSWKLSKGENFHKFSRLIPKVSVKVFSINVCRCGGQ